MPLTRHDLDRETCTSCGDDCSNFYIRPGCHDDAAVAAMYDRKTGTLSLICTECDSSIAEIVVAYSM